MAKKILPERLIIADNRDGVEDLVVEGSRYGLFKEIFSKYNKMIKINLLTALFFLPAIIWMMYMHLRKLSSNVAVNYSGNIGIGYVVTDNADSLGKLLQFTTTVSQYLILIPLLMLAFVGLAGAFYAVRRKAQGDLSVVKAFFVGIKKGFADFLIFGLMFGVILFVFAINLYIYDARGAMLVWKIIGIIAASVVLLLATAMLMYVCTQSTFFKVKFKGLVKNTYLFTFKLPLQTFIFTVLGALPFLALFFILPSLFTTGSNMLLSVLVMLALMLFLFFGIVLTVAIWTVYTDYVYDIGFSAARKLQKKEEKVSRKTKSK